MDTLPQDTPKKQCPDCEEYLPATTDYFNKTSLYISPDGLNRYCRECRKKRRKNAKPREERPPLQYTDKGVEVPLTQGKVALIDPCDIDLTEGCRWSYGNRTTPNAKKKRYYESGYAHRLLIIDGKRKSLRLHHLIMERILGGPIPEGYIVDHKNNNPLDNRRENLRLATLSNNAHNSRQQGNCENPYKGIYYSKEKRRRKRWTAQIMVNGKYLHIGRFFTAEEAAKAYNEAALQYHGEFARINEDLAG